MSKDYQNNPINGEEHFHEQLSDYMDGLLAGDAREAVRSHLETCADCRADYIELRATRKLMQNMPAIAAPRAFTLTPEMAGKVRKPSFWESFFVQRNAPRLATGSLVAFLLLFLFVANDFLGKVNSAPALAPIMTTNSQSSPSVSSGGAVQPPNAQGGVGKAAAAPTEITAPNASAESQGNPGAQDQTPHTNAAVPQPTSAPSQDFAPRTTPQESSTPGENSAGGSENQGAQPNTITASGNSSPTTTTLNNPQNVGPPDTYIVVAPTPTPAPSGNNDTGWIALQVGLLALGLGLGVAAFIAWRRS